MKKQFDKSARELLLNSNNWQLICSPIPPEKPQVNNHTHFNWLKTNSDTHPQREIVLALKGSTLCSLNGKCYEISPGTVLLLDNFEKHDKSYPPETDNIEHLWLYLLGRKIIVRIVNVQNRQMKYAG